MSHFRIDFQISFERETLEVLKGLIAKPQAQPQAQASKIPSPLDDEECPEIFREKLAAKLNALMPEK